MTVSPYQTKWAIEVYPAAAEAFALNHSEAKVINLDCNEVLRVAMDGHEDAIRWVIHFRNHPKYFFILINWSLSASFGTFGRQRTKVNR